MTISAVQRACHHITIKRNQHIQKISRQCHLQHTRGNAAWHGYKQNFTCILRAILRRARCLPDPASRVYIKQLALARYRRYHGEDHGEDHTSQRSSQMLHRAKRQLNVLRRANEGYLAPNLKVLMLTYGRSGRRKRELLDFEGETEQQLPHRGINFLKALHHLHPSNEHMIPVATAKHHTLLNSQMHNVNRVVKVSKVLRRLIPDVPELNNWKRPMPQKRLVNFARAHWKMLMDKTLPPLPHAEWERLKRLSIGEETPQHLHSSPAPRDSRRNSRIDLHVILSSQDDYSRAMHQAKVENTGGRSKPHVLNARFMRRLWAQVFAICPKMDWDAQRKVWRVEWGIQALQKARSGRNSSRATRFLDTLDAS